LAYGGLGAGLTAFVESNGYAWMGTWGTVEKKGVYAKIGTMLEAVTFPPEFDDDFLKSLVRWNEAKVAAFRCWRLTTDLAPEDAMHAAYALMTEENHLVESLVTGSRQDESYV